MRRGMEKDGPPRPPKDLGVKVEAKSTSLIRDRHPLGEGRARARHLAKETSTRPRERRAFAEGRTSEQLEVLRRARQHEEGHFADGQGGVVASAFSLRSEKFELPVRLGLVNSSGEQDLIVHVIAKTRFEGGDRKKAFVPSNVQSSRGAAGVRRLLGRAARTHLQGDGGRRDHRVRVAGSAASPGRNAGGGIYGVTCDPCRHRIRR